MLSPSPFTFGYSTSPNNYTPTNSYAEELSKWQPPSNWGSYNTGLTGEDLAMSQSLTPINVDPSKIAAFKLKEEMATPELGWQDYANLGISGLKTLGGLYLGAKQIGLGEKSLANDIRAFNANYNAQRDLTNAAMYDRNVRRNLELGQSRPTAQSNADQYVSARGIKALG